MTVENLTATQPLSPPLAVIHRPGWSLGKKGTIASHGLAALAEDANNSVLEDALSKIRRVKSVSTVAEGPIKPGESATFEVTTMGRYNRLSLAFMLVQTNDAFSGINSVRLHRIKNMRMFQRRAYDAGSEVNNQLATHIPGPCCMNPFVRAPEGELIRVHPGIQDDVGNLNVLEHGWKGKVAKITIKRVAS